EEEEEEAPRDDPVRASFFPATVVILEAAVKRFLDLMSAARSVVTKDEPVTLESQHCASFIVANPIQPCSSVVCRGRRPTGVDDKCREDDELEDEEKEDDVNGKDADATDNNEGVLLGRIDTC